MLRKIALLAGSFLVLSLCFAPTLAPAYAQSKQDACQGIGGTFTGNKCIKGSATGSLDSVLKKVVDILLIVVGAISVIMVIIGGLKYVLSGGDSNRVESAKNTILYALVGVALSLLAFALVNFVTDQF